MPRYEGMPEVGDVLVTREGPWPVSAAIRLGAKLMGLPAFCNHVVIVHHQDDNGTPWGIEGRPGGVGWRDMSDVMYAPLTNANVAQSKTEEQRYLIAAAIEAAMATPYDWYAIGEHTRKALDLWREVSFIEEWEDDELPGHVVCSSLADWAYEKVGLANPGGNEKTRMTSPGDWDKFIIDQAWQT